MLFKILPSFPDKNSMGVNKNIKVYTIYLFLLFIFRSSNMYYLTIRNRYLFVFKNKY